MFLFRLSFGCLPATLVTEILPVPVVPGGPLNRLIALGAGPTPLILRCGHEKPSRPSGPPTRPVSSFPSRTPCKVGPDPVSVPSVSYPTLPILPQSSLLPKRIPLFFLFSSPGLLTYLLPEKPEIGEPHQSEKQAILIWPHQTPKSPKSP